jgi:protein-L-isoaspartate(D-aspartate) O-methyltransferase
MPEFPKIVLDQLKINGIAIAPIGSKDVQQLVKITRESEKKYKTEELGEVVFAPAYGKFGFHDV